MSILEAMLMKILGKPTDHEVKRKITIEYAKQKRQEANARIDSIVAQVNGCGDRWFLQPIQPLDECTENKGDD